MPVVRVDVPEGHGRNILLTLQRRIVTAIENTWAKEHVYVAVREMVAEPGDRTAIMTVDLRPGRGRESERAAALYQQALAALTELVGTEPARFVLLIRESPERSFVVSGGESLPPLSQLTPALA